MNNTGQTPTATLLLLATLAVLPAAAAFAPMLAVSNIVPRYELSQWLGDLLPVTKKNPATIAALYHYAAAAACALVAALCSLAFSYVVLSNSWRGYPPPFKSAVLILLTLAILLAIQPLFDASAVDDTTTQFLFEKSGIKTSQILTFGWDGRILGCLTFLAFTIPAVVCAITAAEPFPINYDPKQQPADAGIAQKRMTVVRICLFLAAAVLVAAMIAAKLRFDAGLTAFGEPPTTPTPNAPYSIYKKTADALTTYWSVVLSLALAALYVPSSLMLMPNYRAEKGLTNNGDLFKEENINRVLRLLAILSPPLIAQILNGITGK